MADDKEVPYAGFGEKIFSLRKSNDQSRSQLGNLCGVAPSTIANYENGIRISYADTALKMAQAFNMTVEELLTVDDIEAEMKKAKPIDEMGLFFVKKAAESAQAYLDGTNALLAGGTLSSRDRLDFIDIMRRILIKAEIRAKKKYTPTKFCSPVWEDDMDELRSRDEEAIRTINEEMLSKNNPTDDEQNYTIRMVK